MVLNGKGNHYGISKKSQAKVRDAIAELNYSPNKFAKSLRTGKSFFIGLIVTDIANPFYSTIAKSIENVLFDNDYNLMVCSTEESEAREKLLVEMMVNQQGVDGLIIASTFKDASFYGQAIFTKVPMVFIDRVVPQLNANYVMVDNYGASYEVVSHLISQGCKSIACFAITPLYLSTINDRIEGYRKALAKKGIKNNAGLIKAIGFESIKDDVERCLKELITCEMPVDGIFALNNHIAVAILSALRKRAFGKLAHIKIACFDDVDTFDIVDKKIISVRQPIEEIGQNSSTLLLDVILGKQKEKSKRVLDTKLVVR